MEKDLQAEGAQLAGRALLSATAIVAFGGIVTSVGAAYALGVDNVSGPGGGAHDSITREHGWTLPAAGKDGIVECTSAARHPSVLAFSCDCTFRSAISTRSYADACGV